MKKYGLCLIFCLVFPPTAFAVGLFPNAGELSYPSLLRIKDKSINSKINYEKRVNSKSSLDGYPSDDDILVYEITNQLYRAKIALFTGNIPVFTDSLARLDQDEIDPRPFKLKEMVFLLHNAVESDTQISDSSQFKKWYQLLDSSMGSGWISSDGRAKVYASLLYVDGKLDKLEAHLTASMEDDPHIVAYIAWLLSKMDQSSGNLDRAIEYLETAIASDSKDVYLPLRLHLQETYVRKYRGRNLANSSLQQISILQAEAFKLESSLKKLNSSLDLLEYPLLFTFSYKIRANLYDALSEVNPDSRLQYESRRDDAEAIARRY